MTREAIEKLEKELSDAISDNNKSKAELEALGRRYRIAKFGSNYKAPEPVVGATCSFCSKAEKDVQQFVAGLHVLICNEFIDLCHELIHEK